MDRLSPVPTEVMTANDSLLSHEPNEHVPRAVEPSDTAYSTRDGADVLKHRSENAHNHQISEETTETNLTNTVPSALEAERRASTATDSDQRSLSIYWSLRSFSASTLSLFNLSSGRPSQDGATWAGAITITNNSGFGPAGTPKSMRNNGVREGRERGGFLPRLRGIGRTGKAPAPVPAEMLKALEVVREDEKDLEGFNRMTPLSSVQSLEVKLRTDLVWLIKARTLTERPIDDLVAFMDAIPRGEDLSLLIYGAGKDTIGPHEFEILWHRHKNLLSLRRQLDARTQDDQENARLLREEQERSDKEWDRVMTLRDFIETRRFEPEELETSIRNEYKAGVRRQRQSWMLAGQGRKTSVRLSKPELFPE